MLVSGRAITGGLKPSHAQLPPRYSPVQASSKLDAGDPPPAPPPGQPAWSGEVSKSAIAEAEANGASTGVSEAAAVPLWWWGMDGWWIVGFMVGWMGCFVFSCKWNLLRVSLNYSKYIVNLTILTYLFRMELIGNDGETYPMMKSSPRGLWTIF